MKQLELIIEVIHRPKLADIVLHLLVIVAFEGACSTERSIACLTLLIIAEVISIANEMLEHL